MKVSLILQNKYNSLLKKKYQYDATVNARCYFIFFKSESSTVIFITILDYKPNELNSSNFIAHVSFCLFFSEEPWFNTIIV